MPETCLQKKASSVFRGQRCQKMEERPPSSIICFFQIELTIVDVFPVPDDLTAAFAGAEIRVNVLETPPAPVKRDASAEMRIA